jgi:hypothetical protein
MRDTPPSASGGQRDGTALSGGLCRPSGSRMRCGARRYHRPDSIESAGTVAGHCISYLILDGIYLEAFALVDGEFALS